MGAVRANSGVRATTRVGVVMWCATQRRCREFRLARIADDWVNGGSVAMGARPWRTPTSKGGFRLFFWVCHHKGEGRITSGGLLFLFGAVDYEKRVNETNTTRLLADPFFLVTRSRNER